jgi:transcriptional regulator with XRE-family HTH domain
VPVGYAGKVEERERARALRAEGWTMPDIAAELGVSRGSVSAWTRDIEVVVARRASPRRPNVLQRAKAAEIDELLAEGRDRVGALSQRDLLVAGAALYAGEGFKRDGFVGLANNDPQVVALFLRWLRTCFTIDEARLRCSIYLHQGLDLDLAQESWSDLTGIPLRQFRKAQRPTPRHGIRTTKHELGCARVWYSCARTQRAITGLVRALLSSTSHIPR